MRVAKVIEALSALPLDAEFEAVFDGFCKIPSDVIWLSKGGAVLMAGASDPLYDDEDGPVGEPEVEQRQPSQAVWQRLGLPDPEA